MAAELDALRAAFEGLGFTLEVATAAPAWLSDYDLVISHDGGWGSSMIAGSFPSFSRIVRMWTSGPAMSPHCHSPPALSISP